MVNTYQIGVRQISVGAGLSLSPTSGTGNVLITNSNPTAVALTSPDSSISINATNPSNTTLQVTPSTVQSWTGTAIPPLFNGPNIIGGTYVENVGQHTITLSCAFGAFLPNTGQEQDFDITVTLPAPYTPSPGQRVFLGTGEYYVSTPGVRNPMTRFFISIFNNAGTTYMHFQVDPLSVALGGEAGPGSYGNFVPFYTYAYGVFDGTTLTTYNFTATYQI